MTLLFINYIHKESSFTIPSLESNCHIIFNPGWNLKDIVLLKSKAKYSIFCISKILWLIDYSYRL